MEQMKKIEDIINYHYKNVDVYMQLKEIDFIPFVGAGLSAGIGIGSWHELLVSLAEKVYEKRIGISCNLDEITLNEKEQQIFNDFYTRFEEIVQNKQIENEYEKISQELDALKKAIPKGFNYSKELIFSLFKKLLESKHLYASYEAAEVLKLFAEQDTYFGLKKIINKGKTDEDSWNVSDDKAVYWLCKIIQYMKRKNGEGHINCVTTNYDDIIEETYKRQCNVNNSTIKLIYLHGNINENEDNKCLALSDIYCKYEGYFQGPSVAMTGLQQYPRIPYLFLGTSFSEDHIARYLNIDKIGAATNDDNVLNFAIAGDEDRKNITAIQHITKAFGVIANTIFFYPLKNKDHTALVTLLHQLARDKKEDEWNNWKKIKFQIGEYSGDMSEHIVSAITWLYGSDSKITFLADECKNEGEFIKRRDVWKITGISELQQFISIIRRNQVKCEATDKKQYMYSVFYSSVFNRSYDETLKSLDENDIVPLGNSTYIFCCADDKIDDDGLKLRKKIQSIINGSLFKDIKCKVVIFFVSSEIRKQLYSHFLEMCESVYSGTKTRNGLTSLFEQYKELFREYIDELYELYSSELDFQNFMLYNINLIKRKLSNDRSEPLEKTNLQNAKEYAKELTRERRL